MRPQAVHDAKVYGFGAVTLIFSNLIRRNAINRGGGFYMNIGVAVKSIYHPLVSRQRRRQADFELAVVGANQHVALFGHKSSTDIFTKFSPYRYVLQIRVAAG